MKMAKLPFPLLADRRLRPSDKLVLLALQKWASKRRRCWPADESIADAAGISRRAVQVCLVRLRKSGQIRIRPDRDNPSNLTRRVIVIMWTKNPKYIGEAAQIGGAESAHEALKGSGSRERSSRPPASRPPRPIKDMADEDLGVYVIQAHQQDGKGVGYVGHFGRGSESHPPIVESHWDAIQFGTEARANDMIGGLRDYEGSYPLYQVVRIAL